MTRRARMLAGTIGLTATIAIITATGQAGGKRDADLRNPAVFQKLVDCRALSDDKARLACFDAAMGELEASRAKGDVVVVDQEEVKRVKRGLFGFSLSDIGIFGGKRDDKGREVASETDVDEITDTISAVTRNRDGGYVLTLANSGTWEQIQAFTYGRSPKPGMSITIKRAALGSYKMSIEGGPGVRARRIR